MVQQLYWAYGSNLNVEHMQHRCPGAVRVGRLFVPNTRLVFRSVADVVHHEGEKCPGGLWRITAKDEEALDRYEGVKSGLYEKCYLTLRLKGTKTERCLFYMMCEDGIMPPSESYLNTIAQGYRDFNLPLKYLDRAVARSWNDKEKTPYLRWRHSKKGAPKLAHAV